MVRNLVGTFLLAGKGTLKPSELLQILEARSRSAAGATAPASGLCLVSVEYWTSDHAPVGILQCSAAKAAQDQPQAAKECSPRRKPWVQSGNRASPKGAKEPQVEMLLATSGGSATMQLDFAQSMATDLQVAARKIASTNPANGRALQEFECTSKPDVHAALARAKAGPA